MLEACTHPSYNDTLIFFNPSFVLIPILKSPFSNQAVLRFLLEWRSSAQAAPTIVDWQGRLTLDPPWVRCHQSIIVSTPCRGRQECLRLRCLVVGCSNEYSSRHLLPSFELLKMQRINVTFVFERNAIIPDLPKCVWVHSNHSWSSFIHRSQYKVFLWIFANRFS